jgi:hypothetical protein
MVNRAYLFSAENGNYRLNRSETGYYDSRWIIPLLWFLFFDVDSVRLKTVEIDNHTWQKLFLLENKEIAVDRFIQRLPLAKEYFNQKLFRFFDEVDFDEFVQKVTNWIGNFLVVDVDEIVQDDAIETLNKFKLALQFLEDRNIEEFSKEIQHYTGLLNEAYLETDVRNYLIGFTYS